MTDPRRFVKPSYAEGHPGEHSWASLPQYLPDIDSLTLERDEGHREIQALRTELTEANSGWSRAHRLLTLLVSSLGTDSQGFAVDRVVDYLKEIREHGA